MKMRNTFMVLGALAATTITFTNQSVAGGSCGTTTAADATPVMQTAGTTQMPGKTKEMNIVQTAIGAGSFKTLVAAVQAAGLVETLSGKGPFTVFAPTDEAFAKLPEGTVEMLLKPENKAKLAAILTYHVVSGRVMSTDVVKLKSATSVQGQDLIVNVADGKVMIDNATVVKADVVASNGVIHVIDTVMLPKEK